MTKPKIRLIEVANAAGVSLVTASRALSNPDRVSKKSREKVLRAASDLGYIQNRLASSLASSKTMVIGAIVPTVANPGHAEALQGLTSVLAPHGYEILLGISNYSEMNEYNLVRTFLGHKVDGIVLTGRKHSTETEAILRASPIPVIEMYEYAPDAIDVIVGFSHRDAGRAIANYMIAKGRKKLAFVGYNNLFDQRTQSRVEGFFEAARQAGDVTTELYTIAADPLFASGGEIVGRIINEIPDVEGIIFAGHQAAVSAIRFAGDQGLHVPERVAIAGYGDSAIAKWVRPSLTTVSFPMRELGMEGGRLLLQRLSGQLEKGYIGHIGFEIEKRESA